MAEEAGGDESVTLLSAPTWAIALTCAVFIIFSLAIHRLIYWIGRKLDRNHNYGALLRAFEKMKDELFMVGILSLALAMGQSTLSKICVSANWYTLAPLCKHPLGDTEITEVEVPSTCPEGHVPFMTTESIHDLHILVFTLAVVHILYSVMIMVIGTLEVRRWQAWEAPAAEKLENEKLGAEGSLRITRQTTFVQKRGATSEWLSNTILAYVVAFFKQFYRWRVSQTDYITLRSGFIKHHCPTNPSFNFHKFILRSFQDDCKHVVGISWRLWAYAVLWLVIDINGWETNLFVTLAPLLFILVVGGVMQHILTKMANKIHEQHSIVIGMPAVMPDDKHFWRGGPRFILRCFHFIVFQNALGTAYAIWASVTFPSHNCLYGTPASLASRIVIGVVAQAYCGLLILPVYVLVSQMGSRLKKTIFSKDVSTALLKWSAQAKRQSGKVGDDGSRDGSQNAAIPPEPVEGDSGISLSHHEVDTADVENQSVKPDHEVDIVDNENRSVKPFSSL